MRGSLQSLELGQCVETGDFQDASNNEKQVSEEFTIFRNRMINWLHYLIEV